MADEVVVDTELFLNRLTKVLAAQKSHADLFGGSSCLMMVHGRPTPPGQEESHSVSVQKYLLGYEFPDTIMLLESNTFTIHASAKKLDYIRPSAEAARARGGGLAVNLIVREKGDANQSNIDMLLTIIRGAQGSIGHFPNDAIAGSAAAESWMTAVTDTGKQLVDATRGIEYVFAVKDDDGVQQVIKAGHLTSRVARNVFARKMESVIDEGSEMTLAELSNYVQESVDKLAEFNVKVDTDNFDIMLKPVVQSGGVYNVHVTRPDVASSNAPFTYDAIIFSLAMKYKTHGALVARTFFVDPTTSQNHIYSALLDAQVDLIDKLRPGAKISDVVTAVRDSLLAKDGIPMEAKLSKNFGCGFGLRANDRHLVLSAKNETIIEAGMTFAVWIGLSEIPVTDSTNPKVAMSKISSYSVLIADTVVVGKTSNDVVTDKISKERVDVEYELNDEGEKEAVDFDFTERGVRSTRLQARKADMELEEEARKRREEHQELLFQRKKEAARRGKGGAAAGGAGKEDDELAGATAIEAYKAPAEFPRGLRPCQIAVDKTHDAVLLPMFGTLVPFHVSTIKSVVKSEEGHKTFLRFNFYAPGQAPGKDASPSILAALGSHPDSIFVRTLNFMSRDQRNMNSVVQLIKAMQKKMKTERDAEKQKADLVEQPKLMLTRDGKIPRLQDLNMWPSISGRRTRGVLEAHSNGLRFVSEKGEKVEIIYSNIRHGIFQPCEKEHIVLIHFHLKHAIVIGKKKYKDVQFFTEVIESSQAIDGRHRSDFDADEMAEEERERKIRNEMNKAFRKFVERVQEIAEKDPGGFRTFDIPTSDLTFHGTPNREMVNITPCADCLVSLVDKPPFVASVDDIDHVHFERVTFTNRDFDMVLIFKAGSREKGEDEFVRVCSIPRASLDMLKTWLDEVAELTYTEGALPVDWKKVIEEVVRDESWYMSDYDPDTGVSLPVGWDAFRDQADEDNDAEDEEESDYGDDDDDEDEEEEDDDDDEFDELVTDEDDDDDDFDDDDDDEDGEDWDELEKKAEISDRKRKREEDEEDEKLKKKRDKNAKKPRKA